MQHLSKARSRRANRRVELSRSPISRQPRLLSRMSAALLVLVASGMALEAAAILAVTAKSPYGHDRDEHSFHVGALVRAEPPRLQLAVLSPSLGAISIPEPPLVEPEATPEPDPAVNAIELAPLQRLDAKLLRFHTQLLRMDRLRHKIHFSESTPARCLPKGLVSVLYDLAERFGDIRIHSTNRDPRRNARAGGARFSLHLECRAIDFAIEGRARGVSNYLENHPKVGGFGRYPGSHFHIDDGPKRSW